MINQIGGNQSESAGSVGQFLDDAKMQNTTDFLCLGDLKRIGCGTEDTTKNYRSKKYEEAFRRSIEDPEAFWAEISENIDWHKPWTKVLDNTNQPFTKWFVDGEVNACYNALDRHVLNGKGTKVALIHNSPMTSTIRKVTYKELLDKVSALAGALAHYGVKKGDRVLIYMPLIPETIMAMLATVRIGAIHSVVFGGFAARELRVRIEHAEPKIIIAANCGVEPNKIVPYKEILNNAINDANFKPDHCIIFQRPNLEKAELIDTFDVTWDEAVSKYPPHACVPVEANHPLYILYTSGTTGDPKGILRPTGSHLATLCWSMQAIYGMSENDVWWTASDMGWVLGHSYICYGPLTAGLTSVMYEGKPDRTPDAGQYFRVICEHKVNGLLTAPAALRIIKREDPDFKIGKKFSVESLRTLFIAGEHCDYESIQWAQNAFKSPILNHWWQTETGHPITASCMGLECDLNPPRYSVGLPVPGYDVRVLRPNGSECNIREQGRIAIKLPLPPGNMCTLFKAPKKFVETYFSTYDGFYDTMDAGYKDEHGYVYVVARDDDVINVSGHRLSTSALEEVVLSHVEVVDAAVVGVPESTKGEIPLCLYVVRSNCERSEDDINAELRKLVRELIGPIAACHLTASVKALPRTRSGKIARKSIAELARNKLKIPATIEDPSVYKDIKRVLVHLGYAKMAPEL